jgi:hypothetical protein
MHPNYRKAKDHAEEIRSYACDLLRKIDDADRGEASDHDIEMITTEIDRHANEIGYTLGTRAKPAPPNPHPLYSMEYFAHEAKHGIRPEASR